MEMKTFQNDSSIFLALKRKLNEVIITSLTWKYSLVKVASGYTDCSLLESLSIAKNMLMKTVRVAAEVEHLVAIRSTWSTAHSLTSLLQLLTTKDVIRLWNWGS